MNKPLHRNKYDAKKFKEGHDRIFGTPEVSTKPMFTCVMCEADLVSINEFKPDMCTDCIREEKGEDCHED